MRWLLFSLGLFVIAIVALNLDGDPVCTHTGECVEHFEAEWWVMTGSLVVALALLVLWRASLARRVPLAALVGVTGLAVFFLSG